MIDLSGDPSAILRSLAIKEDLDENGNQKLSLNLDFNPVFGILEYQAIFDADTSRWRLVAGAKTRPPSDESIPAAPISGSTDGSSLQMTSENLSAPWTDNLPRTAHVESFKNVNWAATPLGPLQSWGSSLRLLTNMVMADGRAAVLYWGDTKVAIFNEKMERMVVDRLKVQNYRMGATFAELWPEYMYAFDPMFKDVASSGVALDTKRVQMFAQQDGVVEEIFCDSSFLPLRGDDGRVGGFYNRATECTIERIRDRHTETLRAISTAPDCAASIWNHLFSAFEKTREDFPAALAYSAENDEESGRCTLRLQSRLGIPQDHPSAPREADLYEGKLGLVPYFRKAKASNRPIFLHKSEPSFPHESIEGFNWPTEPSRSIAIIPVAYGESLYGIVAIFLNPRRPFDVEYDGFIQTLSATFSATIMPIILQEAASQREKRLTYRLEENQRFIRHMTDFGPIGMCRIAPSGLIIWANEKYHEITGYSKDPAEQTEMAFLDFAMEESQPDVKQMWTDLCENKKPSPIVCRLKRLWTPPRTNPNEEPVPESAWVMASAYSFVDDGAVRQVLGVMTDISHIKWAESIQTRSAAAATEARIMQEKFIDVTSHEMRNPLSAITQCADGISRSADDLRALDIPQEIKEVLESNIEAANTILLCASHQKRIIDDVLTLSKLDSMMLSITPIPVQAEELVKSALNMFDSVFISNGIEVESIRDSSYDSHSVEWATLDPSRVTQIFINLLTNAIKFTKLESTRKISIRFGASETCPPAIPEIQWFPSNLARKDLSSAVEWGDGEADWSTPHMIVLKPIAGAPVYLFFAVQDTGRGLQNSEMTKLFNKFQQATNKTHIQYGGSGLGLFISRELTEMQGGEIGVTSQPGKGSTFAFYVKSRRSNRPQTELSVAISDVPRARARSQNTHRDGSETELYHKFAATPSKLCLLLVEDNLVNQKVLSKQLARSGCEVHVANHGMEALELLQKTRVWRGNQEGSTVELDAILMDVEMPIMDGLTCTRRIRQLEADGSLTHHIDIIAITANARIEQINETTIAGCDAVLVKPFKVMEVLDKVRRLKSRPRTVVENQ